MKFIKFFLAGLILIAFILLSACGSGAGTDSESIAATNAQVIADAVNKTLAASVPTQVPATPEPTATLAPTEVPTATPNPIPCNLARFVSDPTYPDWTSVRPNTPIYKTWRVKNDGSCAWTPGYAIVFVDGQQMGGQVSPLTVTVNPGETVDLSVNLSAPGTPGAYQSNFKLRDASNNLFGVTNTKDNIERPLWIRLKVLTPIVVLDLAPLAEYATWQDGLGTVSIRTHIDGRGEVYVDNSPHLETGGYATNQGIVVMPDYSVDGYLEGRFYSPLVYTVQPGDRFVATVGCRYGANCLMEFRLSYISSTGQLVKLKSWYEKNEKKVNDTIDVDLSHLAGQTITFVLTVAADGDPIDDIGIWLYPRVTGYR